MTNKISKGRKTNDEMLVDGMLFSKYGMHICCTFAARF